MRENLNEILNTRDSEYISIGISPTEEGYTAIPVPWVNTATAYNMKIPNVYITKEELSDDDVLAAIKRFKVIGFYVDVPLDDYEFLRDFPYIRDLNILHGENISDLSFLESLEQCRMLYMENITVKDLQPILRTKQAKLGQNLFDLPYVCIGLCNCKIEDVSGFDDQRLFFSEFIVWNPKERNERSRWKNIRASTFKYYELESKG